jgi:hypothetical protein
MNPLKASYKLVKMNVQLKALAFQSEYIEKRYKFYLLACGSPVVDNFSPKNDVESSKICDGSRGK